MIKAKKSRDVLSTGASRNFGKRRLPPTNTPTVHERLIKELVSSDQPDNGLEVSAAHARLLLDRYPALYREAWSDPSSSPFARDGFSCGDGWFDIIDRLSAKLIIDPNLSIDQLKEKFGVLCIYFNESFPVNQETEAATDFALVAARDESALTCELCGAPGTLAWRGTRKSTRCEACAAKDEARK